jgi:hypothetical protein
MAEPNKPVREDAVTVEVDGIEAELEEGLAEFEATKAMVSTDPEMMGRAPCFAGTRISSRLFSLRSLSDEKDLRSCSLPSPCRFYPGRPHHSCLPQGEGGANRLLKRRSPLRRRRLVAAGVRGVQRRSVARTLKRTLRMTGEGG